MVSPSSERQKTAPVLRQTKAEFPPPSKLTNMNADSMSSQATGKVRTSWTADGEAYRDFRSP